MLVYPGGDSTAKEYARKSYENVKSIKGDGDKVEFLPTKEDVLRVVPVYGKELGVDGGYVNWGSGWADAEGGVKYAKKLLDEARKVVFRTGEVERVLFEPSPSPSPSGSDHKKAKATGVLLTNGATLAADLIILATGAWTPKLVDLRGKAVSTGQIIAYMRISDEEQARLANLPTILNFATGIFIIPPRNNLLKIARHAYGYHNPKTVAVPGQTAKSMEVSLPEHGVPIPLEGENAIRTALKELLPAFAGRPFTETRVCWYTDTYVPPSPLHFNWKNKKKKKS